MWSGGRGIRQHHCAVPGGLLPATCPVAAGGKCGLSQLQHVIAPAAAGPSLSPSPYCRVSTTGNAAAAGT